VILLQHTGRAAVDISIDDFYLAFKVRHALHGTVAGAISSEGAFTDHGAFTPIVNDSSIVAGTKQCALPWRSASCYISTSCSPVLDGTFECATAKPDFLSSCDAIPATRDSLSVPEAAGEPGPEA